MAKASGATAGSSVGADLRTTARQILADARAALEDGERTGATSIHDFRKSMKRWRALLRLLGPSLGASGKKLNAEARDFARRLGRPRDAQAALDALDDLQKHKLEIPEATQRNIRTRLNDLRAHAEVATLNDELRREIQNYLDRAARAVNRWPAGFDNTETAKRLTGAYRRARRAIPDKWHLADEEKLHDLRRRVIAYRHQADLAARLQPKLPNLHVNEAQDLRERLGRFQDLSVLSKLTAPQQPLTAWRSKLAPSIAERQAAHVRSAARIARRLFADRPKAFRRRLPVTAKTPKASA
jgi:CHAD domain-containing protein